MAPSNDSSSNRLEDRIRLLCDKLIATDKGDSPEFQQLAKELRTALNEHIERVRKSIREYPAARERRSRKGQ